MVFKQLRDESTPDCRHFFCEEKPKADKSTKEPAQTPVCQGDKAGISYCELF